MNRHHHTEALHTACRSNIMIIILIQHPRMFIADAC